MSRAKIDLFTNGAVSGCALPPGWLSVDGISKKQTAFVESVQQLPIEERDHGLELEAIEGNDPEINVDRWVGLGDGDFAFVGTSFLRSLLLCLQIATNRVDPSLGYDARLSFFNFSVASCLMPG